MTLAYGITLQNATVIPSSDFAVSTAKVGTNKWRILAYSPTNKPLSANVGDLMTLNIQTEELLSAGTRTVTISDFTLTNLGANNYLSYISLDGITSSVTVTGTRISSVHVMTPSFILIRPLFSVRTPNSSSNFSPQPMPSHVVPMRLL